MCLYTTFNAAVLATFIVLVFLQNSSSVGLEFTNVGYGTKTPYYFLRTPDMKIEEDDLYNANTNKLTCGAVHVSAVIRHGARNPGHADAKKILDIHLRIKDNIDKLKFQTLVEWSSSFPLNDGKHLNDAGEEEQNQLSQRIVRRLKSLFIEEDLSSVRFMVSSTDRAESSAAAFYDGFTGQLQLDEDALEDEVDSEISDELLRFYTLCKKFQDSVENNETAIKEHTMFSGSDLVSRVLEKVRTKLGVAKNVLERSDLQTMFVICGSEMAVFKKSPWCDLFDEEDLEVMEYWTDLKKYYKYGPAYKITREQSCPLISELFTVMDDVINSMERTEENKDVESYLIGNFMFGHAETLAPLYAALGLFNDSVPLMANNFNEHKNRLFRSSHIFPFSANIMFILYECEENEELINDDEVYEEIPEDYLLQVLINEKPIILPGCDDVLCSYRDLRERYLDLIDDCHLDFICSTDLEHTHDEL